MAYATRTAVTGDPIALTFVKLIDHPAIAENQYGNSTPIFSAGRNVQVGMAPNRIDSNKPLLFTTSYDSWAGFPGSFTAHTNYGVSHADYAVRVAGTIAPTASSEYFEKQAYIDGTFFGFQLLHAGGDNPGAYSEDVLFYFARQNMGDFTGGEATPVIIGSEESDTITFEDEFAALPYEITVPSLASTPASPEALVVFNANYWSGSALAKDWYGAFKIPSSGSVTRIALFQADPSGASWQDHFWAHCRDDTNHYFLRRNPDGTTQDLGALTVCQEQAWGTPTGYANYAILFSDANLPASLGALLTDADANYKWTAIYGTDRGFLLSFKKNNGGTWEPKFALLSKDCTAVQHITATAGDATATTILAQGVGNTGAEAISMMAEGEYAWMIGGTPEEPLIVEADFAGGAVEDEDTNIRVWPFSLDGHDFAVFRLGSSESLIYDLSTDQWSRWISPDVERWRPHVGQNWSGMSATTFANGFGSDVVCGDDTLGVLYILDPTAGMDDDPVTGTATEFTRKTTGLVTVNGRETIGCGAVTLGLAKGDPAQSGASITLRTSDDWGNTWVSHGSRTITASEWDAVIEWRALGRIKAPGRIFELTDNGASVRLNSANMR